MAEAQPASPFQPHRRIAGKFRLRRMLGVGGMGQVWAARNEATGADVALKVLRRADVDEPRAAQLEQRFRQEARLSATLSHRNIIKVFDLLDEPDGTLVLVMELLRGETLKEYLEREGPRSSLEAVAILTPILGALAHAHDRGIVHRDVTPSNILLAVDPDGHVTPKLLDFGIAKLVEPVLASESDAPPEPVETIDGRVLGTPRYMAPERIRGSRDVTGRADVFGVAVVLYETITGLSPFGASTASASLAAVLERHVDPDPSIEPRLWVEIQRALSKRAYERHASAREFASALSAALGAPEGALEATMRRPVPGPVSTEDTRSRMMVSGARLAADLELDDPFASVATGVPRRHWQWVALAAIGVVAGAIGFFVVRGLVQKKESPAPPPVVAAAPANPPPGPVATDATHAPVEPPAAVVAQPPPTSEVLPAPRPSRRAPTKPKAIATTPGF